VLDQLVPPIIRDSRWFMYLPMRLAFGRSAETFMSFKEKAFGMTPQQFGDVYEKVSLVSELQGETDLNDACLKQILRRTVGDKVLDAGCGRGLLAGRLAKHKTRRVTGCDIVVPEQAKQQYPTVKFVEGSVQSLPFKDNTFSTVVCTHTLEHVQDLQVSLAELRRVTAKRLIMVVPKQRPYKYGFSLHIHFFPYKWSIEGQFGYRKKAIIKNLDGDWYYEENL